MASEGQFYQKSVKPAGLAIGLPECAGFLLFENACEIRLALTNVEAKRNDKMEVRQGDNQN